MKLKDKGKIFIAVSATKEGMIESLSEYFKYSSILYKYHYGDPDGYKLVKNNKGKTFSIFAEDKHCFLKGFVVEYKKGFYKCYYKFNW